MTNDTIDERTRAWLAERFWRDDELLADARERFRDVGPSIEVHRETGSMLATFVRATAARRVLEIGTLFAYSAVWMGRALPDGGSIDTLELEPEHARFARELLREAGLSEHTTVHEGPALATLATLAGPYDLAFIDADKEGYADYLERVVDLVRPGGTIIADNVIWSGRVADPANHEPGTLALRRYLELAASHPLLDTNVLPIGDGVAVSVRR